MPDCNHDCASCGKECGERTSPESFLIHQGPYSNIKKIIAVVSGKGGVGKSLSTSLLAVNAKREGKKVAILDADVTGPSIPTIFGLHELCTGSQDAIYPVKTKSGIEAVSLNLLTDDPTDPVIWRGPVVSSLIKQFYSDVAYGDVDIVEKALKMARMMDVPVIGLINNYAYLDCPHCGERIYPFGKIDEEKLASKYGIDVIDGIPFDSALAARCDSGTIEDYEGRYLSRISEAITKLKPRDIAK